MRQVTRSSLSGLSRKALPCSIQACLPIVGLSAGLLVASSDVRATTSVERGIPAGCSIVSGSGSMTFFDKQTLRISQSSDALTIDCDRFDVDADTTVTFEQNTKSIAIIRVRDGAQSEILGTMNATGRVALLNHDGIAIGASARVSASGFVASSLSIDDADLIGGVSNFRGDSHAGSVSNAGAIVTSDAGSVALVASKVENDGSISAPRGNVLLAAGRDIHANKTSNQFDALSDSKNDVTNRGSILAAGGEIGIYAADVTQNGVVDADTTDSNKRGAIVLQSSGTTLLSGHSRTSAISAGRGGDIDLLGAQVGVTDDAIVDASGTRGGGTILVGGDFHGENSAVKNAGASFVGARTQLIADAKEFGVGGKIIVWSDRATRSYGHVSAQGGASGGSGGFVENSSADGVDFRARVAVSAPRGNNGTLLIDPATISIEGGTGDGDGNSSTSTFAGNPSGTTGTVLFSDTGPTTIYQSELEGLPPGTSIVLQATDYINVDGTFAAGKLLLPIGSNITLSTRNGSTDGTGTKGIDLTTSTNGVNLAIQTQGGNVTLQTGTGASPQSADLNAGPIITGGGLVMSSVSGNLTVRGINTYSAPNPGANVSLSAGVSITIGATIDAHGYTVSAQPGGTITLSAGGPIEVQSSAAIIGGSLSVTSVGGFYSGVNGPVSTQIPTFSASNSGSGIIDVSNSDSNLVISSISQSSSGDVKVNNTGGYGISLGGNVDSTGPVTLAADTMSLLGGTFTIAGNTPITLLPSTFGRPVDIGGNAGQFPGSLQLLTADLNAALPSGADLVVGTTNAMISVDTTWTSTLGTLDLQSAGGNASIVGGLSVNGGIAVDADTGISISNSLSATGNTISLKSAAGDITEFPSGGISSANLAAVANGGGVTLNSTNNNVGTLAGVAGSATGFTFFNTSTFAVGSVPALGTNAAVTGISAGSNPVVLSSSGGIVDPGGSTITGSALVLSATDGVGSTSSPLLTSVSNLQITNATAGDVVVSNTGDLTVSDVDTLGYGVSQSASPGNVSLTTTGALTVSAPVQLSGGAGNLSLADGTGLSINGALSVPTGSTVSLQNTNGDVTQSAPMIASHLTVADPTGNVTLSSSGNVIGALGPVSAAMFSLTNGGNAIALGNSFTLNLATPPVVGQTFVLITSASSVNGSFQPAQVNGLAAGESPAFTYTGGQAVLTIEKATTPVLLQSFEVN